MAVGVVGRVRRVLPDRGGMTQVNEGRCWSAIAWPPHTCLVRLEDRRSVREICDASKMDIEGRSGMVRGAPGVDRSIGEQMWPPQKREKRAGDAVRVV